MSPEFSNSPKPEIDKPEIKLTAPTKLVNRAQRQPLRGGKMTIKGVLGRFFLIYLTLIIIAGIILNYLQIGNSGVNTAILFVAIYVACSSFVKKNGRYFTKNEKTQVIVGFIAIDITIQAAFILAVLAGEENFSEILIFSVGSIGLIHAVCIYFFVGWIKRIAIK